MAAPTLNREILRLAVPALGSLIAEPMFLIVDSALVGHLGVVPLAGLGIASAVLQTIVGLMVFLAYSTTPAVARRFGAGEHAGAVRAGIDGLWLALADAADVLLEHRPQALLLGHIRAEVVERVAHLADDAADVLAGAVLEIARKKGN